jgi:hypothetical protein
MEKNLPNRYDTTKNFRKFPREGKIQLKHNEIATNKIIMKITFSNRLACRKFPGYSKDCG